jgi:hypothetical protein
MSDPVVEYWWSRSGFPRDAALVPGTDEIVRGGSSEQVWPVWLERCKQLGMEFDNPLKVYSDACCRALPVGLRSEACHRVGSDTPEFLKQQRLVTWDDLKSFFSKVWDWWKAGECVSQEEADRRAEICAGCALNQRAYLPGCGGCSDLGARIFKFIGDKKTKQDASLQSCGHCGCQNSVIVWAPLEALLSNETQLPPPPNWCWKTGA